MHYRGLGGWDFTINRGTGRGDTDANSRPRMSQQCARLRVVASGERSLDERVELLRRIETLSPGDRISEHNHPEVRHTILRVTDCTGSNTSRVKTVFGIVTCISIQLQARVALARRQEAGRAGKRGVIRSPSKLP